MEYFTKALGWYVVFLFSTTLHEAAHAWAAQKGGDLTAYHAGLTLFLKEETATVYQDFIDQPMLRGIGLLLAWHIFDPLLRPLFFATLALLYV